MDLILSNIFDHGKSESGFWPNASQALLIRIILNLEPDVQTSYSAWRANVDFDSIGLATLRFFPLLLPRITELALAQEDRDLFLGARKQTWWKNQKHLSSLDSIRESFLECDVKFIPLKGIALLLDQSYAEAAERYTQDIDILIHPTDLKRAVAQLEKDGWLHVGGLDSPDSESTAIMHHAMEFTRGNEENLDLHWSLFHRYGQLDNQNDSQWEHAVTVDFRTSDYLVLSATDQLLHTCVHGARWAFYVAPIRWIVDAYRIINSHADEIDWDRLVLEAEQQELVVPVRDTLLYLSRKLQVAVPESTLNALADSRVSKLESVNTYFTSRPYMWNFYPQRIIRIYRYSKVEHPGFKDKYENLGFYIRHVLDISMQESIVEAVLAKTKRLFARIATNR